MSESQTAENISEMLMKSVNEWNLKRADQMPSLTTDNAANLVNAASIAGFSPHIRCVAHNLNLATQKGLRMPEMERFLSRIRRVVSFFHRRTTAMAILHNKQAILEIPQHKFIEDVTTRWNSTYDMVRRFIEQHTAIEATLQMKEIKKNSKEIYSLSDDDIRNAEGVIQTFEPLKTATTSLCSEKSPTISLIHPLKEMLLQQLQAKDGDSGQVTSVKEAISADLTPRYNDESTLNFLLESSCLDSRFKKMPYITDAQRREVFSALSLKAATNFKEIKVKTEKDDEAPGSSSACNDPDPPLPDVPLVEKRKVKKPQTQVASYPVIPEEPDHPPEKKKKSSTFTDLFGENFVTKVEQATSLEVRIDKEITNYKSECSILLKVIHFSGGKTMRGNILYCQV